MSDLIKKIKIKKQDGTYTDYIPIGAEAKNVDCSDGESVEYKLNKKPYYYNSVADMKADTKLKVGDMAITLGYYEPNGKGSAKYIIVKTSNNYYEKINNNLFAELTEDIIYPEMLGAYGDGTHDDSEVLNLFFSKVKEKTHIKLKNNYGLKAPVALPSGYGISIDGGTFTTLNNFDSTKSSALLYIPAIHIDQPDGFGIYATGLRLTNLTFNCQRNADGIYFPRSLNVNIDKCLFLFYKQYGINIQSLDHHDLIISNCQFRGNGYGDYKDVNVDNIGVNLNCADAIVSGCVFANGYAGMRVAKGANLIENCHFYAHQNSGYNLKLGSFENVVTGCYFDGGSLWLSSGWKNKISDCLFNAASYTEYMVKVSTDDVSSTHAYFFLDNCIINDERTDQTNPMNFITYDSNITSFSGTTMKNNKLISGNIVLNNPFNDIQINDVVPCFLNSQKYVASVNNSTYQIGEFTPIDGSTQYYKVICSGSVVESEFIGSSSFYHSLVIPFYVTEKTRVACQKVDSGNAAVYFYDENHNFISYNKATLTPGLYYIALYKTISLCALKVES